MKENIKLYKTMLGINKSNRNVVLSNLSKESLNELYNLAYKKSKKRVNVLREIEFKTDADRDLDITKKVASGGVKGAGVGALVGAGGAGAVWAAKRLALKNKYKRCADLPPAEAVECRKAVEKRIEMLAKRAKVGGVLAALGGAGVGGAIGGTKGYVKGMADDDKYGRKMDSLKGDYESRKDALRAETIAMVRGAINSAAVAGAKSGYTFTRAGAMKKMRDAYRALGNAETKLNATKIKIRSMGGSTRSDWIRTLEGQLEQAKLELKKHEDEKLNVKDKTAFEKR
jgi:hypothetical protein